MTTRTATRPLVLVVDGDPDERERQASALRRSGFTPIHAASAGNAFRIATAFRPDVVVTAARLPSAQTGRDLIRRLRQRPETRDIPVICLTSSAFDRQREEADCEASVLFVPNSRAPDALVHDVHRVLSATSREKRRRSRRMSTQ